MLGLIQTAIELEIIHIFTIGKCKEISVGTYTEELLQQLCDHDKSKRNEMAIQIEINWSGDSIWHKNKQKKKKKKKWNNIKISNE